MVFVSVRRIFLLAIVVERQRTDHVDAFSTDLRWLRRNDGRFRCQRVLHRSDRSFSLGLLGNDENPFPRVQCASTFEIKLSSSPLQIFESPDGEENRENRRRARCRHRRSRLFQIHFDRSSRTRRECSGTVEIDCSGQRVVRLSR